WNLRMIILFFILLIILSSHFYSDVRSNVRQGMLVWEALFSGNFFHYYSMGMEAVENGLMIHYCNYDMILNIIMGIWQLPLYIIEKIIGGDILKFFWARVYSKLYLLALVYFAGIVMKKIALQLGVDEEKTDDLQFMFFSSVFVLISAVVASQVDIVGLLFILLSLYFLMMEDDLKFMVFFTLAVQCKFFAFFIFLPIILLREKRIWKILLQLIIPFILTIVVNLPFSLIDPEGTGIKGRRLAIMVEDLLGAKTNVLGFTVPTIFLIFAVICIIAYYIDLSNNEDRKKWYLYFGFLGTVGLFITLNVYPYWFIYFTPFITLFFFLDGTKAKRRLLFETICSWSMAVGIVFSRYWCFSAFRIMFFGQMFSDVKQYLTIEQLWMKFGHVSYYMAWTITYGIFVAWLLLLLFYHCPLVSKRRKSVPMDENIETHLWIRAGGNLIICNAGLILFLIGQV
ncbi:MAG: hypothetical protein K2K89_09700, partial [Ruminococcus sp.]|nr:hypothetical protein [Ruminococcus sp.]